MADYINLHQHHDAHVIQLSLPDTLDMVEFDAMQEQLLSSLEGREGSGWVLDLAKVDYMGSAMLGLMVNIRHRIRTQNGTLILCNCSDQLLGILRASSMHKLFPVAKSLDEAARKAMVG